MIYIKCIDVAFAFVASIVGRIDIAVALASSLSSIVVVSPTRHPSPSSFPRTVHRHCALLSITVELSSRHPLLSIAIALKVHHRCAHVVPCRPTPSRSVVPSISIESPSRHPSPLRHMPSMSPHPLPSIALNPFIAVELPSHSPLLFIALYCPQVHCH